MPRFREATSQFGRYLQNWMLDQRPAQWSTGDVGYHIGVTSQAVWTWLYTDTIPTWNTMIALANVMHRPLEELYEAAGRPLPPAPRRNPSIPPPETREERIQRRIVETVEIVRESMRLKGKSEREIEEVVQAVPTVIRDRAEGTNRIRYIEHEWAAPSAESVVEADSSAVAEHPADYTEQPTQILQPLQAPKPKPPEQQERRAPRKRGTAPPRKPPRSSPDR